LNGGNLTTGLMVGAGVQSLGRWSVQSLDPWPNASSKAAWLPIGRASGSSRQ